MFDRFTERARESLSLARQASQRFNHDYIGTEHMLLGILDEGTGVAVQVMRDLGVDPVRVRVEVMNVVKAGTGEPSMGQLPFTPRGKVVLERALHEAQTLGHDYISTEHLLLGLIGEGEGIAAQVLLGQGLTLDASRARVVEVVGTGSSAVRSNVATSGARRKSPLRYLGFLGLLGFLGFVDIRLGYLGFLGFLGFLGEKRRRQ